MCPLNSVPLIPRTRLPRKTLQDIPRVIELRRFSVAKNFDDGRPEIFLVMHIGYGRMVGWTSLQPLPIAAEAGIPRAVTL